ncbi:uncharacterized protein PHACADRAFT_172246 [Phanerochaete carnosa HHB-10118-sp]|uniref:Peptidase A1 domain-containing protein n=1 Tax=Phanerochaete carnosa (strain HHB-10118-sp) TaxID=650164 RepID=K5V214_PHACS|nr:uncharacterized protein PHACADRAFT_172246 [Phanerochaete carnosa HHB-10118-sp]EKM56556.1 hypothetical protein PHACADRAFT_172246 [Phanerochaete carnosa HHB-10118-sp]
MLPELGSAPKHRVALVECLALALTVAASPVVTVRDGLVTLPFAKRVNFTGSASLLSRDRDRVHYLKQLAKTRTTSKPSTDAEDAVVSISAENQAVSYVVNAGVGSPPTTYSLLVDTGSSNTWVGAGRAYVRTSSSVKTGDSVSAEYGTGSFSGTEFTDTVTLAPGLVITNQFIGVASTSSGFEGIDVTNNLFSQESIPQNLVVVSFEPATLDGITNGELTFGGTDSSKYTGSIHSTPLTTTSPASYYWGIDESITYGALGTSILTKTAGIVDTGTTLVLIASDAFSRYQKATGAVMNENTGLLRLTKAQLANLQSLFFRIDGATYEFTANAQLWPRALNAEIGGDDNSIYLAVSNLGTPTGEGLDFINGQAWLERFYSVYDTGNQRMGFATTPFTYATTN